MNKAKFEIVETYMLSCMDDAAHDKEHICRVLYNALNIAKSEKNVDYDVLITACLLHDIARREQFENPEVCHALLGGEKAYIFLTENGFSQEFAEKVKSCIQSHRYRQNRLPQSIEAKILFDADKVEAAGALGIARTLTYRGVINEPLYAPRADGSIPNGENDSKEEWSFFSEYKYKLEKIYSRFFTEGGKKLAEERRQAAVDFYNSLYNEVSSTYKNGREALDGLLIS